jgi:hypothetical protein
MSNFICDLCGASIIDSDRGYTAGCEHYPKDMLIDTLSTNESSPMKSSVDYNGIVKEIMQEMPEGETLTIEIGNDSSFNTERIFAHKEEGASMSIETNLFYALCQKYREASPIQSGDTYDDIVAYVDAQLQSARQDKSVKMPTNTDEAELMQKIGFEYLTQYAPERLTEKARQSVQEPVYQVMFEAKSNDFESNFADGEYFDVTKEEYDKSDLEKRRILYASPQSWSDLQDNQLEKT